MDCSTLILLAGVVMTTSAWSAPFYPGLRTPLRVTRYAPAPPLRKIPVPVEYEPKWPRPKRQHDYDHHHSSDHDHRESTGVAGPIHTFVKTDKNANYKWGVRHHVGNKYAS